MKKIIMVVLTMCLVFSLTACGGNSKPEDSVLENYVISHLGNDVELVDFKVESFESEDNDGTAICEATYEKDDVSIEKTFTIQCTKQEKEWVVTGISKEDVIKATPLKGVNEDNYTQETGWQIEISDHNTDLEGLKDELTITKTREEDGVKATIVTKKQFDFKGEKWDEILSDEILNTVEPTRGVLEDDVLKGYVSGKIIEHETDLENQKDSVTIEQVQENYFFKKTITTNKEYEFQNSSWEPGWAEISSESTDKIEDINLAGSWAGKETVTTAWDAQINGTYDFTLTITELGTNGEIKGEIE